MVQYGRGIVVTQIAIDTNLLLLLVVGHVSRPFIRQHKRLAAFTGRDFDQLSIAVIQADSIVTTPNVMTEVSNLAIQGVLEPYRSQILEVLVTFSGRMIELYRPTADVLRKEDYIQFGLTDSVWLQILDNDTILMSDDRQLCRAAEARGFVAYHVDDLRGPSM